MPAWSRWNAASLRAASSSGAAAMRFRLAASSSGCIHSSAASGQRVLICVWLLSTVMCGVLAGTRATVLPELSTIKPRSGSFTRQGGLARLFL